MRKIDIQITQGRVESFKVEFEDENVLPMVSAVVGLYTADGKKVTTFSVVSSNSWYGGVKFELPVMMIEPIVEIGRKLEEVVIRETRKDMLKLEDNSAD